MYIINKNSKTPLHIQLYEEIKKEIISQLKVGDKLQSIRKIATQYNLSKNSVESAYSQLVIEGYVESYSKRGYFVIDTNLEILSTYKRVEKLTNIQEKKFLYDFHPARLEKGSFPLKIWKRTFTKAIDESIDFGRYSQIQGEYGLRDEVSKYLIQSRGINCDANQVVICNGFSDSMGLIISLLKKRYKTLAIENPGYAVASKVFEAHGYKIKKIPVDNNGIHLEKLKESKAKLVYITPSHQYPTGVTIPISNRIKLLNWAKENDALIIEDDYDSELTYENRPIPALQGLDRFDKALYVGTFSKSLSPAIRVSYLVLPKFLVNELNDTLESKVCLFTQKTLELFLKEGHWDRHLRKIRTQNKKKYLLLKKQLQTELGSSMKIVNKGGGLAIHINPTVPFDFILLKKLATDNEIKLHFAKKRCGGDWDALMMGFGGLKEEDIIPAVQIFAIIWKKCILDYKAVI